MSRKGRRLFFIGLILGVFGIALGPYAMAAALSKMMSKKSPFHYLTI